MAESVHLFLKANGSDIKGDSSQTSLGRANSIECLYYEQGVASTRETGSNMATGRRQYAPLVIRKRIDRSSPLLLKALVENQKIEGQFKFFRPSPAGDGTTEQFYTVQVKDGQVASVRQTVPNTMSGASANEPPVEEISFVFKTISWTYTDGGISHEDTWGANR